MCRSTQSLLSLTGNHQPRPHTLNKITTKSIISSTTFNIQSNHILLKSLNNGHRNIRIHYLPATYSWRFHSYSSQAHVTYGNPICKPERNWMIVRLDMYISAYTFCTMPCHLMKAQISKRNKTFPWTLLYYTPMSTTSSTRSTHTHNCFPYTTPHRHHTTQTHATYRGLFGLFPHLSTPLLVGIVQSRFTYVSPCTNDI